MPVETMQAVRCLVIGAFCLHQQAIFGQYREQSIPAYFQRVIRLAAQQVMQLACANSWLTQPHMLDVPGDLLILLLTLIRYTVALVVGLTSDPKKLASPDDGQCFDLTLREDLPGCFFTMETP